MNVSRVIVTGGSGGIGGAIVARLASRGASIVNLDVRPGPANPAVETLITDVADAAAIEASFAAIDKVFDGHAPDLFVGCAALSRASHVLDVPADELDLQFAVNVRGLYLCAQAAARRMAKSVGGSMVFISSVAAEQAWVSESVYCLTKAATRAMMQSFAVELAPYRIRVNCVAPGPIDHNANAMAATRMDPEILRHELERTPMGRFGSPHEVAEAVEMIASATWATGTTFTVDGGYMATGLGLFGSAHDNRLARTL